jgi:SWI/SNF-related matrix-associated actin-dependent regulator of chromatin subfamily A-like protein 1
MKLALAAPGIFVAECAYEERAAPKEAGFLWHGKSCRPGCYACGAQLGRVWWTRKPECASRLAAYATPEALEALGGHLSQVVASKATSSDLEIPAPAHLAYLPYQKAGIAYALGRSSTLIGDEMGLGKTIQAIGVINADSSIRSVLIICPASLRLNWKRELVKWLMVMFSIEVLDDKHPTPCSEPADIVIANYDRARKPDVHALLMARRWDLIVCDEAHRLKNPKAQQTKAILGVPFDKKKNAPAIPGLVSRANRKLFLTGTPVLNRPIELFPLLSAIAPADFGNFFAFAKRYCNAREVWHGNDSHWDFSGSSHLEELQEKLRASCMIRRLKADVLTELPPKRRQIVTLPAGKAGKVVAKELDAYDDIAGELEVEAEVLRAGDDEDAYQVAAGKLAKVKKIAFDEISDMRHKIALMKVPAVIEHVEDALESTAKIILFAHHRDVIAQLVAHFGDACVSIVGDTSSDDRQLAVDRFQTDPAVRLFVGSIGACREGLTLTAATTVIFAELDWVPANVSQAEDRAHRIGQTGNVLVQHLVLDGSLDARMVATIIAKQGIADAALDGDTGVTVDPAAAVAIAHRLAKASRHPVATESERARAHFAMKTLAGMCDGAIGRDEAGFSRLDTGIGKRLAAMDRLSDGQVVVANRLAIKYRRQLMDIDALISRSSLGAAMRDIAERGIEAHAEDLANGVE